VRDRIDLPTDRDRLNLDREDAEEDGGEITAKVAMRECGFGA
jgi:hypothetical protein